MSETFQDFVIHHKSKEGNESFYRFKKAGTFWSRLCGLMGKVQIPGDGLILYPSQSIHTFFMKISIDVLFITKSGKVLKIYRDLKPWRHTGVFLKSYYVIETYPGHLVEVLEGDQLQMHGSNFV